MLPLRGALEDVCRLCRFRWSSPVSYAAELAAENLVLEVAKLAGTIIAVQIANATERDVTDLLSMCPGFGSRLIFASRVRVKT